MDNHLQDDNIVKIDLTDSDVSPVYDLDQTVKYDKLPHIKSTQSHPGEYSYPVKVKEKSLNPNQTVIFPISEYNQNLNFGNNAVYTQSNLNVVNNTISTNSNMICNPVTNVESSTINLNVLNQAVPEMNQGGFTNVISNVTSTILNGPTENDKVNVQVNTPFDNTASTTTPPVKMHVCDICSRAFKRREHLYQHVKLHTGFRPYICENCNKAFMRKEHLLRHSTLHSGQKNYTCNICDKSFSRNDNLLKHKKTHEKQSSYTCEICQKQFVMKHYYNAHKLSHGDKCYVTSVWGMLKT